MGGSTDGVSDGMIVGGMGMLVKVGKADGVIVNVGDVRTSCASGRGEAQEITSNRSAKIVFFIRYVNSG